MNEVSRVLDGALVDDSLENTLITLIAKKVNPMGFSQG